MFLILFLSSLASALAGDFLLDWHPQNRMFSDNVDNLIHLRMNDLIVFECNPDFPLIIHRVRRRGYQDCTVSNGSDWSFVCQGRSQFKMKVRPFAVLLGHPVFMPNAEYYFITTSVGDNNSTASMKNIRGGMCTLFDMRIGIFIDMSRPLTTTTTTTEAPEEEELGNDIQGGEAIEKINYDPKVQYGFLAVQTHRVMPRLGQQQFLVREAPAGDVNSVVNLSKTANAEPPQEMRQINEGKPSLKRVNVQVSEDEYKHLLALREQERTRRQLYGSGQGTVATAYELQRGVENGCPTAPYALFVVIGAVLMRLF